MDWASICYTQDQIQEFFQISLGVLIGIALGATAIGVPVSEVGKHFPNETRTLATGYVTAAASVGYFLSPLFTQYSLGAYGWEQTLKYFMFFIAFGLIASLFLLPSKNLINSSKADREQSFKSAIKEAFSHKGYVLLVLVFLFAVFKLLLSALMFLVTCKIEEWEGGQLQLF